LSPVRIRTTFSTGTTHTFALPLDVSTPTRVIGDLKAYDGLRGYRLARDNDSIKLFCDLFCKEAAIASREIVEMGISWLPGNMLKGQTIPEKQTRFARMTE
jgi:hypothetical protein